jgi:hypothetical protein
VIATRQSRDGHQSGGLEFHQQAGSATRTTVAEGPEPKLTELQRATLTVLIERGPITRRCQFLGPASLPEGSVRPAAALCAEIAGDSGVAPTDVPKTQSRQRRTLITSKRSALNTI